MYGVILDIIRGFRSVHYSCFRSTSCKKLSRLSEATINIHIRHCTVKPSTLELLQRYSISEQKNIKKNENESMNNVKELENGRTTYENIIKNLSKELDSWENKGSADLLTLDEIIKMTNISPEQRIDLAEKLFERLRSLNIIRTEEHYIGLWTCYLKSECSPNVQKLLSQMENDGVQLSEKLQQSISKCLFQCGNHRELESIIKTLKQSGLDVSTSMNEGLVYSYALSGNVDKALEEYNKLFKDNDSVGKQLKISLLRGAIKNRNENLIKEELTDLLITKYEHSSDVICTMFEEIAKTEHFNMISHMVQVLDDDVLLQTLTTVLAKLVEDKNIDNAYNLLKNVYNTKKQYGVQLPSVIYKDFISDLIRINHPLDDLIKKCGELREIKDCEYVMEYLLFNYLIRNKFSESLEVIYALADMNVPIEQHYFWPLFIQAHKMFDIEGIFYMTKVMFAVGSYPDSKTILNYIYPYINPNFIFKYIKLLSPSGRIFQFFEEVFIVYALENGYYEECLHLMRKRPLNGEVSCYFLEQPFIKAFTTGTLSEELISILKSTNGVDPYTVISKLFSDGEEDRLRKLLKLFILYEVTGMKKHIIESLIRKPNIPNDIKTDLETLLSKKKFNVQSKKHSLNGEIEKESMYECAQRIEDMEIHKAELLAKQMNPAGQIFRLLKYYMKFGLYNKALQMRNELFEVIGLNIEFSPSFIACMCRLAEYEKNWDEAMRYYQIVRYKFPNFLFDVPKTTGLCTVFIIVGAEDELLDLIERMPKWWGNQTFIEHKMVAVLKKIASLGDIEKTKIVFNKLLEKNLIMITKNTLQVFVETYLEMGNLEEAVNEFRRIIAEYKIIPSAMKLLWDLIRNYEFEKMEDVLEMIMQNSNNGHNIVFLALRLLACLGDLEILKKYYEMYEVNLMDKRFDYVLSWEHFGGDLDVRMKAFRTFILNAKSSEAAVHSYARLAVDHVCCEQNGDEAEKLQEFLRKLGFLRNYEKKLENVMALTKAVEKTINRQVPFATVRNKETIWKEQI